jgi:hypothetical protein
MINLLGAFFLALDRLQQLPGDGTVVGEGVAMADPAAVECVLRHWTLGDTLALRVSPEFRLVSSHHYTAPWDRCWGKDLA